MEQDELLRRVVEALERLRVPYLVTGSIATIFFGEPRFTNDIDIVVRVTPRTAGLLADEFPGPEFFIDREAAREAAIAGRQFNLIHPGSGLKVDFIVAPDTPFNRSRFSRGLRVLPAADLEASFATPEDVILMKMDFYRRGGSERHLRDIAGVLRISGDDLDHEYIRTWAERLGVEEIWDSLADL